MSQEDQPQSHIERLSVELLRMVVCALPDVATLQSVVLSCPTFYLAFREAEKSITTAVLFNQIDVNLWPDAAAAFESSSLESRLPDGQHDIKSFITNYISLRPTLPRAWLLRSARRVGGLQTCISQLALRFTTEAMACDPLTEDQASPPPTPQEVCRLHRAFYRFEIYCNIFRDSSRAQTALVRNQYDLFFRDFTSCEIEQLGCIHDFLTRLLWPGEFEFPAGPPIQSTKQDRREQKRGQTESL